MYLQILIIKSNWPKPQPRSGARYNAAVQTSLLLLQRNPEHLFHQPLTPQVLETGDANKFKALISHLSIFPGGSVAKNLLVKQETQVRSLGQEDPWEKEMATQSSILA